MTEKLRSFLDRIAVHLRENWTNIRELQKWMVDEATRKHRKFPYWRKKVLFTHVSWKRKHTKKEEQDPRYISAFLYSKFDWLFQYFFEHMFYGFSPKQLQLIGIEGDPKRNNDLFFLYEYRLTNDELEEFSKFKAQYNHPDHPFRIISYIFNSMVNVFSSLLTKILKVNMQISIICADIRRLDGQQGASLQFLICSRKPETEFLKSFLNSLIYDFAELLPGIDHGLLKSLLKLKEKLYPMALDAYPTSQAQTVRVFYTLQRKAQVLRNVNPLLDILNFIASRVEDSIFQTNDLVYSILESKYRGSSFESQIPTYMMVFEFLNKSASMFSTFQSNNRAVIHRQYHLFFFYSQYFLSPDIFDEETQMNMIFPEQFQEIIQEIERHHRNFHSSYKVLNQFLMQGIQFVADRSLDALFLKIFNRTIHSMNESFFEAVLKSINHKFTGILMENMGKNRIYSNYFDEIVHVICVIMLNLVNTIFLRRTPEEAQVNFRDNLSRYTPQKIALRVLELRIFKDVPLADNNWQDYYLSRNKNTVKRVFSKYYDIPDNYFFTEQRLLKINMNYERGILEETPLLEQWLIDTIILPFDHFYSTIQGKLKRKKNSKDLRKAIFAYLSKGIIESPILEKIEDFADYFTTIWQ